MRRFSRPRIALSDLAAIVLVWALSTLIFSKNIFVDNAVVFHDEYIYKVSAEAQLVGSDVVGRQLAMDLPNHLFFELYGYGAHFGSNFYAFAQLINTIFWAMGLLLLYGVAVASGLTKRSAFFYLLIAGLLPLSSYTKYFMPEAMYFAMFCGSLYALVLGVRRDSQRSSVWLFISGLVVGGMYFVKPHALPLLAVNVAFLAFFPGRARSILAFLGGAFLSIIAGRLLLSTGQGGSGLGTYAQAVGPLSAKLSSYFAEPKVLAVDLLKVSEGHIGLLSSVFGVAFIGALMSIFPRFGIARDHVIPDGIRAISIYLLLASTVLVGMAIVFTLLAGEIGRVHSRYYFFIFPIALLMIFHFGSLNMVRPARYVAIALISFSSIWLALRGDSFSQILPISLVSDSPEWGFVYFSKALFYVLLAALAGGSILAIRKMNAAHVLIAVIGALSVVSSLDVVMKQKGVFRNSFANGRAAVAVEEIIGKDQLSRSVVVGENWDGLSKFLFNLTSTPSASIVPSGGSLDEVAAQFPSSPFIVVVSPGYQAGAKVSCRAEVPGVQICAVAE